MKKYVVIDPRLLFTVLLLTCCLRELDLGDPAVRECTSVEIIPAGRMSIADVEGYRASHAATKSRLPSE